MSANRRRLGNQTAKVDSLFAQLHTGEVLFIGYRFGNNPDGGLYLFTKDQAQLESRMTPACGNPVTFYAVPDPDL